jgi:dUTP pyrophosphatase
MMVKIVNKSTNPVPGYSTDLSAGMDLRAFLTEEIILQPLQRVLVPTGLFNKLPIGYEAQIRPGSGLALKHGITVLNTTGTIDTDYRGKIWSDTCEPFEDDFVIKNGERI